MKKTIVMIAITALVVTVSVGAYAHYDNYTRRGGGWMPYNGQNPQMGPQQGGMYGRGGHRMYNQRGGMMYGQQGNRMAGPRGGMMYGSGYKGNMGPENCPYGGRYGWNTPRQGENIPNQQPGTAPEIITEEQAKTAAEEYVQKYLSGYTVESIEKDSWRPLYVVTIKGADNVEQQMIIHGFSGQVMHVFPKTAE